VKRLILLLLCLFLAGPATAGAWSKTCTFTGGNYTGTVGTPNQGGTVTASLTLPASPPDNLGSVGDSTTLCYRWAPGEIAHNVGPISVAAPAAFILFDPALNAATTVPTATTVIPHACPEITSSATPGIACPSLGGSAGNASLTGVEGPPGTENQAKWVGPGLYYFEVTACVAGSTCQIMVRGSR
jgi:hypothetical protein